MAMLTWFSTALLASASSCSSWDRESSMFSAYLRNISPYVFSSICRPRRSNSRTPNSSSSFLMLELRADWEIFSSAAALVMCCSLATLTKLVISSVFMKISFPAGISAACFF